ncbi:MAG: hypothetical protein J7K81_04070 [Methanophagales archaeon]|nr:hypothetical protein [Methanophagales archaeon]
MEFNSKITYTYKGKTYTNYLGNYLSDYKGSDDNNNGIGDSPYSIKTGSYPQIIHEPRKNVTGGTITCDQFIDANGKIYTDWIPAIKFFC